VKHEPITSERPRRRPHRGRDARGRPARRRSAPALLRLDRAAQLSRAAQESPGPTSPSTAPKRRNPHSPGSLPAPRQSRHGHTPTSVTRSERPEDPPSPPSARTTERRSRDPCTGPSSATAPRSMDRRCAPSWPYPTRTAPRPAPTSPTRADQRGPDITPHPCHRLADARGHPTDGGTGGPGEAEEAQPHD
jgi:hypothetical protein